MRYGWNIYLLNSTDINLANTTFTIIHQPKNFGHVIKDSYPNPQASFQCRCRSS